MEDNIFKVDKDGEILSGEYEAIEASGNAKNAGDLCANKIHISGNATLSDTVEASTVTIDGNLELDGVLRAEVVTIKGNATIKGTVEALKVTILGNCEIKGDMTNEELTIKGNLLSEAVLTANQCKIEGTLNGSNRLVSEQLEIEGKINYEGTMEAQSVRIKAFHKGYVMEIKAGQVEIMNPSLFKHPTSFLSREYFSIEKLECSAMYAESTGIALIRGENIQLAKKCVVEELYYLDSLTATDNCQLEFVEQITQ